MIRYLATLDYQKGILWDAFLWYLVMAIFYAAAAPMVWLRSFGLAGVVGRCWRSTPPRLAVESGSWDFGRRGRFYLIPFCVASFSAFTKEHAFI